MVSLLVRALAIAGTVLVLSGVCFAGTPSDADRATARELGSAGLAALDAKDYATAFDRLSRAIALYDVPTLRLGAARALRGMGRLVSAAENYRAILLRAPSASDPPPFVQAQRDAKRELPEVEARVAHLTVMLSGGPSVLRVDGAEWPAAAVGVPRPLDPGEHVVEARGSTQQVQSQKVTLAPGENARLDIASPADSQPGSAAVGASPVLAETPGADGRTPEPVSPPPAPSKDRTVAIVTAVVAGALATGAVVTGVMALGKKSDFNEQNRSDVPFAVKDDLRSQASTLALVSTVLTGAALVGTGVSVYFWLTPSRTEADTRAAGAVSTGLVFATKF